MSKPKQSQSTPFIIPEICDCGHPPDQETARKTKETGVGFLGYGTDPETGKTACYNCCNKRAIAQLDETKPGESFPQSTYLVKKSEGNPIVTTFTGATLANVSEIHDGYVFGTRKVVRFWAKDVHGGW